MKNFIGVLDLRRYNTPYQHLSTAKQGKLNDMAITATSVINHSSILDLVLKALLITI